MPYPTDGPLPRDTVGFPVLGVFVPNVGTVAAQGGSVALDATGTPYASLLTAVPNTNIDNVTLINAVAATTSQTSSDQTNSYGRGVIVYLNMVTVGTGSVTLTIQGKDPVSGTYYTLLAGVAVTTNSFNVYTVYPGNTVTANVSASTALPKTWRVSVVANNANPVTYTVSESVIL
jgi:hypothetical protein